MFILTKILVCILPFLTICQSSTLYTETDDVTSVSSDAFKQIFILTKKDYVVQFYHSHCGHCISFAPKFKAFATGIKDWKPLLEVIVIDCADSKNSDICSEADIGGFPTIAFYPRGHTSFKAQIRITAEPTTMVDELIDKVILHSPTAVFKPIESNVLKDNLPPKYILLKGLKKKVALRVILQDTSSSSIPILWSEEQTPEASATYVNGQQQSSTKIAGTWPELQDKFRAQLVSWNVWSASTANSGTSNKPDPKGVVPAQNTSRVHYVDIQSVLTRVLFHEVPIMINDGKGDKVTALRGFIDVLVKYLPSTAVTSHSLVSIQHSLATKTELSKTEWKSILRKSQFPQLQEVWMTCLGSAAHFRRYPCGLWTLFHALTVSEWETASAIDPRSVSTVLPAMKAFILTYFSCTHCVENFRRGSANMEQEMGDVRGAVLWLWRGHNRANSRLKGDASEDPQHPKVQFPTKQQCPQCRTGGSDSDAPEQIHWVEEEVLKFLQDRYTAKNWVRDEHVLDAIDRSVADEDDMYSGRNSSPLTFVDMLVCAVVTSICTLLLVVIFWVLYRRCRVRKHGIIKNRASHEV